MTSVKLSDRALTQGAITVRVASIKQVAPAIKEFVLQSDGAPLPRFSPGSHILLIMSKAGKTWCNPYSLINDPNDTEQYRIAVRLQDESRGGSVFMHHGVKPGDILSIKPPANLFAPYWRAKKHLLVAGGVGITPFMSFIPELLRQQANIELHYLFHGKVTGAYQTELKMLLGQKLFCYDSDLASRCAVSQLMASQPLGTHVYVCGPTSLLDEVQTVAQQLGWPAGAVHYETFSAPAAGLPFEVHLAQSDKRLQVGAEESLLEALEAADFAIPNSCRGGVCGRCITQVLEGEIDHRDGFLSADEKARQHCVMPCVSRAANGTLTLDL